MEDFLEDNANLWVQVFAEFETFIYVSMFEANNEMLRKIFLESKRIHIRMLYDFFSNHRIKEDDLISSDLLSRPVDLSASISGNLRILINKSTAHLTLARGTISVPDSDYIDAIKSIFISICHFIKEIDQGNVNETYKEDLNDKNVMGLKWTVKRLIHRFADLNRMSEVPKET